MPEIVSIINCQFNIDCYRRHGYQHCKPVVNRFFKTCSYSVCSSCTCCMIWVYRWLQNFAYRIPLGWQAFALAGMLAVLIACITISFQAVKAAIINPVKSLRASKLCMLLRFLFSGIKILIAQLPFCLILYACLSATKLDKRCIKSAHNSFIIDTYWFDF